MCRTFWTKAAFLAADGSPIDNLFSRLTAANQLAAQFASHYLI
jgi:hypothetical protein